MDLLSIHFVFNKQNRYLPDVTGILIDFLEISPICHLLRKLGIQL